MYYSDRLYELLGAMRHDDVVWFLSDILRLCELIHLKIYVGEVVTDDKVKVPDGKVAIVSPAKPGSIIWPPSAYYMQYDLPIVIQWHVKVDGRIATYHPYLEIPPYDEHDRPAEYLQFAAEQDLIRAAGIEAYSVELPESVVTLPLTPWVNWFEGDYDMQEMRPYTCGRKEARSRAARFIRELAQTVGLDVSLSAKD